MATISPRWNATLCISPSDSGVKTLKNSESTFASRYHAEQAPRGPILLVDADVPSLLDTAETLTTGGHHVMHTTSGNAARALVRSFVYPLILVGESLADGSGIQLVGELRLTGVASLVMFVASCGDTNNKVQAFNTGVDDYLVKPLERRELLARVSAHIRRFAGHRSVHRVGRITLSEADRTACVEATPLELTRTEFEVLRILVQRAHTVIPRDDILTMVWGKASVWASRCLDVHLTHLRRKLGSACRQLQTVRGRGIQLLSRPSDDS